MKVKTMKSLLTALLAVVLCVACGEKKNEYASVIPANSPMVISANLNSLGEKASLKDYKGMIEAGLAQVQQEDAALYEQLKSIVDDPSQLGLALDAPMYLFTVDVVNNPAAVFKVADKTKLTVFMKSMQKDGEWECREENGVFWVAGPVAIAVSDKLMLVAANSLIIEELLKQPADESIVSTPLWADMESLQGDVKMCYLPGKLSKEVITLEMALIYKKLGIDLNQYSAVASLDFQNGEAIFHSKANYSEEMHEITKNMLNKVEGKHLKMIPGNPAISMTMNINMGEILTFVEKMLAGTPEAASLTQAKPLLATIDGELTFALNGMSPGSMVPDLTLFAEVKDRTLETMLSMVLQPQLGISHGMIGDNLFYLTTNKEVAANPGKLSQSAADAQWAGEVKGSYMYMVVNFEPIKQLLTSTMDAQEKETLDIVLNTIEDVEVEAEDLQCIRTTVRFSDKQTNALTQLIRVAAQMKATKMSSQLLSAPAK